MFSTGLISREDGIILLMSRFATLFHNVVYRQSFEKWKVILFDMNITFSLKLILFDLYHFKQKKKKKK